jgi:predicted dehydrogenase
MARILLIGAGQLGSRYLQGLAAIEDPVAVKVVDPSEGSLAVARERLAQVQLASAHAVQFSTSLEDVPQHLDLALVVTPAHCRARVVTELASRHQVQAWVLEKVLAQNCEQLDQIEQALVDHSQVWVNTPRRLMGWHQAIRSQLLPAGPSPLQLRVSGGSWGLACNAIHFIDLVAWWTQASVQSVNPAGLADWVQSKRAGFQEVFGSFRVTYADGSELELCCHSEAEPTQITVVTPQGEWVIEESAGLATGPDGQQLHGQLSFQSALTVPLVKKILQEGRCDLPTLAESAAQHRPLLSTLLKHWNQNQGCHDSIVPIT